MINIEIKEEYAYKIAYFLGVQDIDDTTNIVKKYGLKSDVEEYEKALQNLFSKLSCKLELER